MVGSCGRLNRTLLNLRRAIHLLPRGSYTRTLEVHLKPGCRAETRIEWTRRTSTHVHYGPVLYIRNSAPEYLMRDRRDIASAENHEPEEIQNRIPFGPAEVGVREMAGSLLEMNQECRDGISDHRTRRPQNTMVSDPAGRDVQRIFKL